MGISFWIYLHDHPLMHHMCFSVQHNSDLLLLNQEIGTPSNNLNHQDTHVCEKQGQDDFLVHATELTHNFALPKFISKHWCEDMKPIDTPSRFSSLPKLPEITP